MMTTEILEMVQAVSQNTAAVNKMAEAFCKLVADLDRYRQGYKEQKQRAEKLDASYRTLKGHMTRQTKKNKRLEARLSELQHAE